MTTRAADPDRDAMLTADGNSAAAVGWMALLLLAFAVGCLGGLVAVSFFL